MSNYNIGDIVRLSVVFKNADLAPTDPTGITFKLRQPNGETLQYLYGTNIELVRDGVGTFHADFTCATDGTHVYEWIGTGVVTTVEDGYFEVFQKFF